MSNKKQSVLSQTPHLQRWRGLFFLALCQRLLADQHPNASYLPIPTNTYQALVLGFSSALSEMMDTRCIHTQHLSSVSLSQTTACSYLWAIGILSTLLAVHSVASPGLLWPLASAITTQPASRQSLDQNIHTGKKVFSFRYIYGSKNPLWLKVLPRTHSVT